MALDLSRERVLAALEAHEARTVSRLTAPRRSAVAALLRFDRGAPDVLVMRRAGHVSFPGGMRDATDPTLLHTACRETLEEVGVDLQASARRIGQLDDVRAIARGNLLPLAITPFVFEQVSAVEISLNHEAESAFWLPLDRVASGELDGKFEYKLGRVPMKFGCWRYDGYVVWGLTYKMINDLLDVISGR